jgi:hypothetical protein
VLVDEVEDAGEDLAVFGIAAADPRQPPPYSNWQSVKALPGA